MTRAVVLAHFDRDGVVDPYVVDAIHAYRRLADRLVVVSTSARALPEAARPVVDAFISRPNVGYDFCSWRAGIEALDPLKDIDELVCVNDSAYGPLFDITPLLSDDRVAGADMWGMVLSEEGTLRRGRRACPHVQSWFFAFRTPALMSPAFQDFWNSVEPLDSKDDLIDRYEIGMTEHFRRAGCRVAAIYDARKRGRGTIAETIHNLSLVHPVRSFRYLRQSRRDRANPSEVFPERLLDAGVPFVKVNPFRFNRKGLNPRRLFDRIRTSTPYDVRLIEDHLARVGSLLPIDRRSDGDHSGASGLERSLARK